MKRASILRPRFVFSNATSRNRLPAQALLYSTTAAPVNAREERLQDRSVPKAPLWLGVAAGGVDLTLLSLSVTPDQLVHLQAVYGVNILSFMGGVHWGLAMANYQRPPSAKASVVPTTPSETKEQDMPSSTGGNREEWRYGLSVVPSLVGFALMAGFASVYAGDLTAASHQMVPRWYLKLRTPLTLIVLLSLGVSYAHLPPQQ
ncbi:uncharacterized protein ACA1_381100 [Acanthamoeba castellanii str. Neff]|uniref:DUF3429 domain-containing protein n=1 Tax=Acanthamoeba castellanii (strain ATCC 30010 / Neff) TaxID=1257118 RepID=L8GP46_ACACF|nr:uncharacterized protein ACA1_381100 [Acanthamoeba castellanii str. Neff]ELR14423.1 hypothetical protein ACA1_381100 [Acanthamoeba castellanii str. Neff]